ncbi:flagellar motor switch protein [Roseivivax halodurans JCM 10272]|uniref:Flagellar motor switch protein n=1 Tax=Roseivivax halodurans JCM 10272 TaxID=1449350 RepID=X7EK58_9RHOB|nr:flagellar motor switch protein [Roseivivax halodurans JCM 10272]
MGYILDLTILALLIGALGFGLVIDRRVRRLMAALGDLEPAVSQFSSAVDRSADAVTSFRSAAEGTERSRPAARRVEPAFQKTRRTAPAKDGTARIEGKSDLVRSFFETVRSREA